MSQIYIIILSFISVNINVIQSRDLHDKQEAVKLSATQSKVVKEAKQASFRQFINKEAQRDGL
jgi:hypothetical protein